jgi:hypothetical protein
MQSGDVKRLIDADIRAESAERRLAECEKDAERYAMLFQDTWFGGDGIAIFRYIKSHEDFDRLGIEEANSHLDRIRKNTKTPSPRSNHMSERKLLEEALSDFTDFLNEPPQNEDKYMVREYRHEAYWRWEKLLVLLRAHLKSGGWISVEERLPDIYDASGNWNRIQFIRLGAYSIGHRESDEKWIDELDVDNDAVPNDFAYTEVTHWQPLPPLPGEKA